MFLIVSLLLGKPVY